MSFWHVILTKFFFFRIMSKDEGKIADSNISEEENGLKMRKFY